MKWQQPPQPPVRTFMAAFPGTCSQCFDSFEEGDLVGYLDDELCCGWCVDDHNADAGGE